MSTRLFNWLGHLAVSYPWGVLTLYALALLATLPLLLRLDLEADVRNTLPPDMARALERHNALFGTADLAFLLVQTSPATAWAEGAQLNGRPFPASVTAEGAQLNVPPFPASATAEGPQLNAAPFPASATAEGAQLNVPPSLARPLSRKP